MNELNAEQIKKALEYAIKVNEKVTKEFQIPESATLSTMRNALSLIKELTEDLHATRTELTRVQDENERLKAENKFLLNIKNLNLDKVKADTVRKMQERLKQAICDNTYPDFNKAGKPVNIWKATTGYDLIDQIAKEMLEGKDEK